MITISALDLTALCGALIAAFIGGIAIGIMWRLFRDEERDSSRRYPRPGTGTGQRFKAWKRHPDMLENGDQSHKKE